MGRRPVSCALANSSWFDVLSTEFTKDDCQVIANILQEKYEWARTMAQEAAEYAVVHDDKRALAAVKFGYAQGIREVQQEFQKLLDKR